MSHAKKPRLLKNPFHENALDHADQTENKNSNERSENLDEWEAEDDNNINVTTNKPPKGNIFESDSDDNSDDEQVVVGDRKPAWVDECDDYTCEQVLQIQGRTCDMGPKGLRDYKKVLEEKYQSVMGVPKWAAKRSQQDDAWLTKSGQLVTKSTSLPKGTIEMHKLKDLNKETYCEGPIVKSVLLHPSSTVGFVAGMSGIVSLFQVDGKNNTKLQSIQYRNYPISCAGFVRGGEEVIVGSALHHYFYSHDLIAGRSQRVANARITDITNLKNFRVSPDGKHIVVLGKFGKIYLLSALTKELICTLRMNGEVSAVEMYDSWMFTHGTEGQVYGWDMNTRQCVHKFIDEGCLEGTALSVAPNEKLLACGSSTGVVNIYDVDTARSHVAPTPLKTVLNLVTPVNCLKFNPTSEILWLSSNSKENAIKLLHCPSMTVFANFPQFRSKLNRPQCVDFSPNSGYLAFGDHKKTAHLFRLKYYGNY